ncbi:MAG: GDP-L-fucose synthase [Bacteroidetes bacterium]|nr:GDP-L-fucose synthase [Bacteroidota bacterium]
MDKNDKIFVCGHRGMVGSSILRGLQKKGFNNLILRTSKELDLTIQADVDLFFQIEKPEYVFLAAARVGGILANNTYRAEFIYTNLQIQNNVIHSAWKYGVKKLLFLSSSCVYPRSCPQPMKEEYLWTGYLEPTNEPYAVAKLAGMSMCRAYHDQYGAQFFSIIPTNLYGPNDNYDPQQSHVMAALILKFHLAKVNGDKQVVLWGTGQPKRELMFVDDAADAAILLIQHYNGVEPLNVGVGEDMSIAELAEMVKKVVGYKREIAFDSSKPDGIPRKLLDISRLKSFGWNPSIFLEQGISDSYADYLLHH